MGLYRKYDFWSVMDGLEKIIDYYIDGNEKGSIYWDFYSDQINEMGAVASDMHVELLNDVKNRLEHKYNLPYKNLEFCEYDDAMSNTAISWWNTAACMLSDIDMVALMDQENPMFYDDYYEEKMKRLRMLERLTKKQQMQLYTEVIGFIERYNVLVAAFETITAVIRELEYHQSSVVSQGGVKLPEAAYL